MKTPDVSSDGASSVLKESVPVTTAAAPGEVAPRDALLAACEKSYARILDALPLRGASLSQRQIYELGYIAGSNYGLEAATAHVKRIFGK